MEKYYYKTEDNVLGWAAQHCNYKEDGTRIGSRMCAICKEYIKGGKNKNGSWVKCKKIDIAARKE